MKNPQGREHTRPFLEWDDAKDSLENCKAAGFSRGHYIRDGLEAILNCRCIFVEITVNSEKRILLLVNSGVNHNEDRPSPISPPSANFAIERRG